MDAEDNARAMLRGEGEIFRRERLRRRLSVAQTANATRLRPRVIEAVEDGIPEHLPSPVFTKGLVQTYARYLGIDSQPYLEFYRAATEIQVEFKIRPESPQLRYRAERVPGVLVGALLSILLLALGGYLYQQYAAFVSGAPLSEAAVPASVRVVPTPLPPATLTPERPAPAAPPKTTRTPEPANVPPPTPTASLPTSTPVAPSPTPTPQGVRVSAQFSGRVWTQVQADGKVVFSGILNSGDQRTWTATDNLMLWAGNAGLVTVTYNGKPLGRLGSPGEVMKVTWTATH